MAKITVGTTSKLLYRSETGTASNPDNVAVRLSDKAGTVYIEQGTDADSSTSFFISDADIFSVTMVAGDSLHAIVSASTEDVVVTAPQSGTFGE